MGSLGPMESTQFERRCSVGGLTQSFKFTSHTIKPPSQGPSRPGLGLYYSNFHHWQARLARAAARPETVTRRLAGYKLNPVIPVATVLLASDSLATS